MTEAEFTDWCAVCMDRPAEGTILVVYADTGVILDPKRQRPVRACRRCGTLSEDLPVVFEDIHNDQEVVFHFEEDEDQLQSDCND